MIQKSQKPGAKPAPNPAQRRARATAQLLEAVNEGDKRGMLQAIEAGADINVRDSQGRTALMIAMTGGLDQDLTTLKSTKSMREVEAKVRRAAEQASMTMTDTVSAPVQILLRAGAQVNLADKNGMTALLYATATGAKALVLELIRHKANINGRSREGLTPLAVAVYRRDAEMIDLLIRSGADQHAHRMPGPIPLLFFALSLNKPESDEGEDIVSTMGDLMGALFGSEMDDAAQEETVNALLRAGADPNEPFQSLVPLHLAAAVGSPRLVRLLLRKGARVNTPAKEGSTALAAAAESGRADIVRVLLEAGADPNTANTEDGNTPLILAIESGSYGTVDLLLKAGAKQDMRNKKGQIARSRAIALKLTGLTRLLGDR